MTEITLEEFLAEMERRGKLDCKFVCPHCGNTASPNDWTAAGGDPQRAPHECIGRLDPKVMAGGEFVAGPNGGCDWAAFGLFSGPVFVVTAAKRIATFEFAP
jgi:hypothetical protein